MVVNIRRQNKKDDVKLLILIILGFLFVAWLFTPPGNKFLQICFWGNNTKYFITKLFKPEKCTEYIFHRNNAVFLAKMYPQRNTALREINKAIETLPSYAPQRELESLYKDRAEIRLFLGDYKGALNDFVNSGKLSINDRLKVALLFNKAGNYREALSNCNAILNIDMNAYAGFACLAEVYKTAERPEVSLKVWDLAILRNKNNARVYADRARLKRELGDTYGFEADLSKAKEYSPTINVEESLIEDTLNPKLLSLSIR